MEITQLKSIIEAMVFSSNHPVTPKQLVALFEESVRPDVKQVQEALTLVAEDYAERSVQLKETASGFRFQVVSDYNEYLGKIWEERPAKYSRAAMETLALIVYRQPITRAEIEEVRGVAVSTNIIRTLEDRGWVHSVGHKDVPGHPSLYATTKEFLDDFNLKSLTELPTLDELKDFAEIEDMFQEQLALLEPKPEAANSEMLVNVEPSDVSEETQDQAQVEDQDEQLTSDLTEEKETLDHEDFQAEEV